MKGIARDMANVNGKSNRDHNITAKITSIDANGKYINGESYSGSEIREMTVMLPFGISSSAIDNISVQVSLNAPNSGTVVGVNDPSRPTVKPGEIILYSNFGSRIEMLSDGTIKLIPGNGGAPLIVG